MFDIMGKRYWYFAFSGIVIGIGLLAMAIFGIPRAIDFTGGTIYDIEFEAGSEATEQGLRDIYVAQELAEPKVVPADPESGGVRFQLRSGEISLEGKDNLDAALEEAYGPFEQLSFAGLGASVGAQVTRNATIAVALAALAIALYLTVMFRHVPHPVRYGVCAIVALIHDVLVVLAAAAIMGYFFGWEIDALFLTGVLTVIGFSVHDSIVVFDRIRENSGRMPGVPYEQVVNHSVLQTLDRSINTQVTALFTLVAIFLYSEGALEHFVFWMIVGMISGTYSSIFTASPLLVVWENKEWRNWFGGRNRSAETAS